MASTRHSFHRAPGAEAAAVLGGEVGRSERGATSAEGMRLAADATRVATRRDASSLGFTGRIQPRILRLFYTHFLD